VDYLVKSDFISNTNQMIDGMSWKHSWQYTGHQGLAGFHFEDGLLPFGNHMFDVDFSEVSFASPADKAVIDMYTKFSRKTWVHSKLVGVEGALATNKWFANQLWQPSFADGLLVARTFVLDPRLITPSMPFEVVHQHPGDFVCGDAGHCVVGGGLVNMACNFAPFYNLSEYVKREQGLADAVREVHADYLYQRQQFNDIFILPRRFSTIGMVSEFFLEWSMGHIDIVVCPEIEKHMFGVMREVYHREVELGVGREDVKLLDDREVVACGNVGRMCVGCGLVCVREMFSREPTVPFGTLPLHCGLCVGLVGGCVVIISDYMAYHLGLL
jgi:hypothetical protein